MTGDDLTTATDAELDALAREANAKIDAAYWAFTRQARAKPPVLAVPDAYARRTAAWAELRKRGIIREGD